MSKSLFGRVTYGSDTLIVSLSPSTTYEEFCVKISSRFCTLQRGQFVMRYALTDCTNCYLETDDDISVMLSIFQQLNCPFIDIHIRDVGGTSRATDERSTVTEIQQPSIDIRDSSSLQIEASCDRSDASDLEDDDNMIIANFVNITSKRKYMSSEWSGYINKIGQVFVGGATEFREKLSQYVVEKGFQFDYVKNTSLRVSAACSKKVSDGCEWYVYASCCKSNGYFHITRLVNTHSCHGVVRQQKHRRLGAKVISGIIADKVRSDPLIKPKEIINSFKHDYGLEIPYYMAYSGKESANKLLHGSEALGYALLPWYIDTLKRTNPGSYCILESKEGRFHRLFISYAACREGFKYFRPMLFLDGTFIKNKYKGVLLGACAKTGNKDVFPFVFAVVDAENKENCIWFTKQLAMILADDYRKIVFMSDRGAGFLEAVKEVFPNSPHSYCIYHLKNNLNGRYPSSFGASFKKDIVRKFSNCACYTVDDFNEKMEVFRKESRSQGQSILENLHPENYAVAFFPGKRYGEMSNALSESFNNMVKDIRCLPLPQLLESIRVKVMNLFQTRRVDSSNWSTILCPEYEKKLNRRVEKGRHWTVAQSNDVIFEVATEDCTIMVNLAERLCSCGYWQFSCFPCAHAVQVMLKANHMPYSYIEDYWKTSFYKSAHELAIFPVPDLDKPNPNSFGDSAMQPPITRKPPGTPRTRRIKSFGEEARPMKCQRCNQIGHHNSRSCKYAI